jgi:hypothetical protein
MIDPDGIVVPLHRTQRQRRVMLINDLMPGVLVIMSGISMMESALHILIAVINILAGCSLLFFGIREWRSESDEESGFNWVDIFGGVVMALDAAAMYKPWKGFQPAWLYILLSFVIVFRGFFPSLFPRLRKLRITREGFSIRFSPFSSFECSWRDVHAFSTEPDSFTVLFSDGRSRTFTPRSVENLAEVLETLDQYARLNGIG